MKAMQITRFARLLLGAQLKSKLMGRDFTPAAFAISDIVTISSNYSLQLIKISHVNIWAQAVNCKIGEITTWIPQRIYRYKDLDLGVT